MASDDAPIRIAALTVDYADVRAVDGLDLTLPRGCIALLGPNGAGKSTTLKSILGFVRPTAGSVTVYGVDAGRHRRTIRRRIGYMPERDAWLAGLSGFRAVALAGELSGLPRREAYKRAHEVLHFVGVGEARYRPVEGYSTGMRQRVKLAQALVHDPPLLFLDEPTNGLDPDGRAEMLALIRDLATVHGKDVVLCTHILRDAESAVSWVAILRAGKVVASGPTREILERPRPAYRVRVAGALPSFVEQLATLGADAELDARGAGLVTLPADGNADVVFRAAAACGTRIQLLRPHRPTLEEAFFDAMENDAMENGQ